jgi:transposase
METYVGIDIHKTFAQVALLNPATGETKEDKIAATPEAISAFAQSLPPQAHVAIESSTNSLAFANLLSQQGIPVVISNPLKTKLIAEAKIKTDKVDARTLAQLLASDFLPAVWQPDPTVQSQRHLVSYRCALVSMRTQAKNRVHSILHRNLIPYSFSDLFGKKGRAFLQDVPLPDKEKWQINQELALVDFLDVQVGQVEKEIAVEACPNSDVKLLMTIPGLSDIGALAMKSAIGEIERFRTPEKLVSYLGLNPSVHQSGQTCYYGRITKRGRSHARWLMIEAAQCIVRTPGPLKAFFQRLKRKKGHNVAIVATARKMVIILWHMLTKHEPYRYAPPLRTKEKMDRLRVKATGVRKKGGVPRGTPRSPLYGTGGASRKEKRVKDKEVAILAEAEYRDFIAKRYMAASDLSTCDAQAGEGRGAA